MEIIEEEIELVEGTQASFVSFKSCLRDKYKYKESIE